MSTTSQSDRGQDPQRPEKNFQSDLDRESLNATREKHRELNDLISNLSQKLTVVASSQEKEFLSAYRVHMLGVQMELKELKQKVAKAELSLQDDGEVSKLEDECNWFRTETNRLNAHCSSMQSDIQSMKQRLATLRDQNEFLSSQLKAVMKRSRVIEVELEYNQQEREERRLLASEMGDVDEDVDDDFGDAHEGRENMEWQITDQGNAKVDVPEKKSLGKSESAVQLGRNASKSSLRRKLNKTISHAGGVRQKLETPPNDTLKYSPERTKRVHTPASAKDDFMKFDMTKAEAAHVGDAKKLAEHKQQLDEIMESKSEIENELEECLKAKFEEVVARRSKTVMSNSKNRYIKGIVKSMDGNAASSDNSMMLETLDSASFSSSIPNEKKGNPIYGGISGLGLEYFTDSDRKDIMIDFLSKPRIFEQVVNSLNMSHFTNEI